MHFCTHCGAALRPGKKFCVQCGAAVVLRTAPVVKKAKKARPVRNLFFLLVMVVAGYGLYRWRPDLKWRNLNLANFHLRAVPSSYSDDQKVLWRMYGDPVFFSVALVEDNSRPDTRLVRQEVWAYPGEGASFTFLDGQYDSMSAITPTQSNSKATSLRPEQITADLSPEQLGKLVGREAYPAVGLPKLLLPGGLWYQYGENVVAVFKDQRLQMVEVLPSK